MKPRVLMFAGSLRKESHQLRLLLYIARLLQGRVDLDILIPAEVDLPLFNQDLEAEPEIRSKVKALHQRFLAADAVIVATPEYNAQIAPFTKNTFDWMSRLPRLEPPTPSCFKGKPLLLCSASTGWTGGIQGLAAARLFFAYIGYIVQPGVICLSHAEDYVTGESYLFEENFASYIERLIDDFAQTATLYANHKSARDTSPLP